MTAETLQSLLIKQHRQILELKENLKAYQASRQNIAIIGIGLRLPGGIQTLEGYWQALREGWDLTGPLPGDRWSADFLSEDRQRAGTFYWNRGAFLQDIKGFDPGFFGISRREALAMDPQQRLLLMVAVEALEKAGLAIERQEGRKIGVFTGVMRSEYAQRLSQLQGSDAVDLYHGTGSGHGFTAGRLSYALGLTGPSLAIDTACSSSLVALHMACESLKRQECEAALVGASNVILDPELNISLCQAGALSPQGRCLSFDEGADGYTRGEGVMALVLMPEEAARKAGHPIWGLIKGGAVNHGGASSGFTIPNGEAQTQVLAKALAESGLQSSDVEYIEAHGTGTSLGDPIELGAIAKVYAKSRPEAGLYIGSVKSQVGHLEAAAGLASVIKCLLMFQHETIPAQHGLSNPNRHIDWSQNGLLLPRKNLAWPRREKARHAGVSAFGISGTNAHVILAEPEPETKDARLMVPAILPLSAKTSSALHQLQKAYQDMSRDQDLSASWIATAARGRVHKKQRLCFVGKDLNDLREKLQGQRTPVAITRPGWVQVTLEPIEGRQWSFYRELFQLQKRYQDELLRLAKIWNVPVDPDYELERLEAEGDDAATNPCFQLICLIAEGTLWQAWGFNVAFDAKGELAGLARMALNHPEEVKSCLEAAARLPSEVREEPGRMASGKTFMSMLEVVAAHFEAGAKLQWDEIIASTVPFSANNPLTPFELESLWVDGLVQPGLPQTMRKVEPKLADVWPEVHQKLEIKEDHLALVREILTADSIDSSLSFLELGGDSFTAMLLAQKLANQGFPIEMEDLLSNRPIGDVLGRANCHADA